MRGLDDWLSRGHERLDDVPEDDPNEQSLLAMVEDEIVEIERELSAAEAMGRATDAFFRKLWGGEMSETGKLAEALAKAQGQIKGAVKDSSNPGFKGSKYADLASVWDACRKPLAENGLSIAQFTQVHTSGAVLVTRLLHTSGESVEGVTPLLMGKQDMQALGSAITYARRYGLAAMVGVAPEDDDGNAAVAAGPVAQPAKVAPEGYEDWRTDISAAADTGMDALRAAWQASKPEYRQHAGSAFLDSLKAKAQAPGVLA